MAGSLLPLTLPTATSSNSPQSPQTAFGTSEQVTGIMCS